MAAPAAGAPRPRRVAARCVLATTVEARALHHEVRHAVFVVEQAVFVGTDRDPRDDAPDTLHALGLVEGVAVGAVRMYPLDPAAGLWKGDRLAVLRAYRGHRVGGPLVRFAVASAARAGGRRMLAHVQPANVAFFELLGWHRAGAVIDYVGRPHQPMAIDFAPASG